MRAMILAAGKGTRLGPLTQQTPKCLIEVGGKPMLLHVLESVQRVGVTKIVVNLHHLAEKVRLYLSTLTIPGLTVTLSEENVLLGTGGGVLNAEAFLTEEEEFLVLNADIFCEFDLQPLIADHRRSGAVATLLTMERADSSHLLFDEAHMLKGYEIVSKRKELIETGSSHHSTTIRQRAFCGIQILSRAIFDHMRGFPQEFSIIDAYLKAARSGALVRELDIGDAFWTDMGTPQKLEELKVRLGD